MASTPNTSNIPTVHKLPKSLRDKPLTQRIELAMQHWLDLYPASTSLRFGKDPVTGDVVLGKNVYGPRLHVMTKEEAHDVDISLAEHRRNRDSSSPHTIASKLGLSLKPWLASDPSVELFYNKPDAFLQYQFRKELVQALNHGLGQIGCTTHRVRLSDHTPEYQKLHNAYWSDNDFSDKDALYEKMNAMRDPKATIVWHKNDKFAQETPGADVYAALTEYFANYVSHPVSSHVTLGDILDVKTLNPEKWEPLPKTEVERLVLAARKELSNPEHPWTKSRTDNDNTDPAVYAYLASKAEQPIVRNGHLLYRGQRFNSVSDTNIGYVVIGTESCGTQGIQNDAVSLMRAASRGELDQIQLQLSNLPDVLVSLAYHDQVHAHQKERAAWALENPVELAPGTGPVLTKAITDLQVGDQVGLSSGGNADTVELWCSVTAREGNTATMFVHNGHWDFKLDLVTNQSLAHDIVKNFEGQAQVVYTADIPVKDGALYNNAIEYMNNHLQAQKAPSAPTMQ